MANLADSDVISEALSFTMNSPDGRESLPKERQRSIVDGYEAR